MKKNVSYDNNNTRWTAEEIAKLEKMVRSGFSRAKVCKKLGRTPSSVSTKKMALGLRGRLGRATRAEMMGAQPITPNNNELVAMMESIRSLTARTGMKVTITIGG